MLSIKHTYRLKDLDTEHWRVRCSRVGARPTFILLTALSICIENGFSFLEIKSQVLRRIKIKPNVL